MDRNTVSESSGRSATARTPLTLLVLHLQHDLAPLLEGGDLLVSAGHGRVAVCGAAGALDRYRSVGSRGKHADSGVNYHQF